MREHTRRRLTEGVRSSAERSINERAEDSINWRIASEEAFGDVSKKALNLRGLRNREGLTQRQFAEAIGVEQSNISKMERGIRQIGIKVAKRIGEVFDIDYHLFL